MHNLKKSLLPLLLAIAMLVMAVSAGAASSPTSQKIDKKSISTSFNYESTPYTGKKKTPKVTVTYEGTNLKEGTDYKVTYSNNTNVGTAKVTITGVGQFTGSASYTFKITKQTLHVGDKTVKKGKKKTVVPYIYLKDKETVATKWCSFKSSNTKIFTVNKKGEIKGKKKGKAKLTITPKNTKNYETATITIIVK